MLARIGMGVVVASLVGAPSLARAQSRSWSLAWRAPAACPSEDHLRGEVVALVGPREGAAPVSVEARVSAASPTLWRAQITTRARGVTGTRALEAPSCRSLADAVTVILAWMIDPEAALIPGDDPAPPPAPMVVPGPLDPEPSPDPDPDAARAPAPDDPLPPATSPGPDAAPSAAPPSPPRRAPPRRRPRRRPRRGVPWRLQVELGARGDLGPLDAAAPAPEGTGDELAAEVLALRQAHQAMAWPG